MRKCIIGAVMSIIAALFIMVGATSPANAQNATDCTPYYATGAEHTAKFCVDLNWNYQSDGTGVFLDYLLIYAYDNINEYETDACGAASWDYWRILKADNTQLEYNDGGCTGADTWANFNLDQKLPGKCVEFSVTDLHPRVNNWPDPGDFFLQGGPCS